MTAAPAASERRIEPDAETVWRPGRPVAAHATLRLLARGPGDPCHQVLPDRSLWRTSRMPTGPVSYRIRQLGPAEVGCQAWGAGADELVTGLPELLGARDDVTGFDPRIALVDRAHRRHGGLRIPRTGRVLEALVPAVLEQRVQGVEAFASWRRLVRAYGTPAPGPAPAGMAVPPAAEVWAAIPTWQWHRAGVDPGRARTAIVCARHARQLEQTVTMSPADAERRLCALPGVGLWTAAEVAVRALGDADAVSVGDYHLAKAIGWTLLGRPIDDAEMLATLAPWRPHRARVISLLYADRAMVKPRRGPRLARQDFRRI